MATSLALSLQLLEPVLDDLDARRCLVSAAAFLDHQKPLAVRRHVVRLIVGDVASAWSIKKLDSRACSPCGTTLHRHAHERAIGCEVEELLTGPRPTGLGAANCGHLLLPLVHVRIRPHNNLKLTRVVGLVRQPSTVGGDDSVTVDKRRLHQRFHAAVFLQGERHHVGCGSDEARLESAELGEQDACAVCQHRRRALKVPALRQRLRLARSVSRLPVERPRGPTSLGAEHEATSIWRPHRRHVVPRIGGDPCERLASKVPDPDIALLIADVERHARPVR